MSTVDSAGLLLVHEARALLTRLDRVRPFSLSMPMAAAAMPSPAALNAIESYLVLGRNDLRRRLSEYLRWLDDSEADLSRPPQAMRQFVLLKLLFNRVLTQFDLFADVMTQRSEHENGVWLAGLDIVAADALNLKGRYYEGPPLICYLDRGHGAAIRRAMTRLPGGGDNPVAVIRIPRERMVGSGIGASLVHEVGHQGVALLGLIQSLGEDLRQAIPPANDGGHVWVLWRRWLSEILADFWALAHLGIGSTLGLISVVSLPRAFLFRTSPNDPHPIPWIRVRLSIEMGRRLFPDRQWEGLHRVWNRLYPLEGLAAEKQTLLRRIEDSIPRFLDVLIQHRPMSLMGKSIVEALPISERQPEHLRELYRLWGRQPIQFRRALPTLAFAVIGQARADNTISPEEESYLLARLLTDWALRDALNPPDKRTKLIRADVASAA